MRTNVLYLSVLPLIHLTDRFGFTEQVLTLFPDEDFATQFHPDEVQGYIDTFNNRADKYLKGGRVTSYSVSTVPQPGGSVLVKVLQEVETNG